LDLYQINKEFAPPAKGSLLISEPFLNDAHFRRSVVLLGEHNEDGSVGFVINRLLPLTTQSVVPDLLKYDFPIFYGGPVEPNTLHFVHRAGDLVTGSQPITNSIYWGGDIELINDLLERKIVHPSEFRFFVGYSGWAPAQLDDEIKEKAWWVTTADTDLIFDDDLENMWKKVVRNLGQDFAYLANSPEDPQWN
jgi:putative transcriptional regulator